MAQNNWYRDKAIINVRGGDRDTRKLVRSIAHWVSRKTMDVRLRTSVTVNIYIQKNLYIKEKVQGLSWIDDERNVASVIPGAPRAGWIGISKSF